MFHTARDLLKTIENKITDIDEDRAKVALTAALVHDLGHGPFSHAFEEATKALDADIAKQEKRQSIKTKKHEHWTSDILLGDTEVSAKLNKMGDRFQNDVANLLTSEIPKDIYAAVVSSQFDADRLDYIRRDRMMTGAQHGGFDYSWLLANLQISSIPLAVDNKDYSKVDSLVIGHKAIQAAESYVLGLFQMYFAVYFHKTTRSAEKMLVAILRRVGKLISEGMLAKTGLVNTNPIVLFIKKRDLSSYVQTDDFIIWGSLSVLSSCDDDILKELATRLLKRDLYKVIDVTEILDGNAVKIANFRIAMGDAVNSNHFEEFEILEDHVSRDPYKFKEYGSSDALSKIHVLAPNGKDLMDLADCSEVVKALGKKSLFRIYTRDDNASKKIMDILGGLL